MLVPSLPSPVLVQWVQDKVAVVGKDAGFSWVQPQRSLVLAK